MGGWGSGGLGAWGAGGLGGWGPGGLAPPEREHYTLLHRYELHQSSLLKDEATNDSNHISYLYL